MNLANLLLRSARLFPERPAIFVGDRPISTYSDLQRHVNGLAGSFVGKLGLRPNDRVALAMSNAPEFIQVLFACWHAGLVAVPMNPRLHARELAYILDHSGARICFATAELAETVARVLKECPGLERLISVSEAEYANLKAGDPIGVTDRGATDAAWLFYTSGTTGRPKGAELSHRNLLAMTGGYFVDFEPVTHTDHILHIGPMCHGSGLYILPHVAAAAAQVIPSSKSLDPSEVFDLIQSHSGMSFFAAPTIVKRLVESSAAKAADVSGLRTIIYGGAPMYVEDLKRAIACFGAEKLAQVYGQGESPMAISVLPRAAHLDTAHPRFEERLGSVGISQSVVEVRIGDADDHPLPPGEPGQVLVRGDTVMNGYYNNPEATRQTLLGGWLHTGDVAIMDGDGFITLKDRSKDVIITGGSNVYPREVEEVLMRHPAVAEVSVIGNPDPEWGEAIVAFVACAPGRSVTTAELDALCVENIARYKKPKAYRFIDALPKSHIGKILKTELRGMLNQEKSA